VNYSENTWIFFVGGGFLAALCRSRANIQPFCHNTLSGQTHRQTERQMGYATGPPG